MNSNISRRDLIKKSMGVLALLTLGINTRDAGAQQLKYPTRPLTILNPANPGGGWDLMARIISPAFEKQLGQPIRQEFLPGASGPSR